MRADCAKEGQQERYIVDFSHVLRIHALTVPEYLFNVETAGDVSGNSRVMKAVRS